MTTSRVEHPEDYDLAIAGAGIVGVSCALWAQMRGIRVVLIDDQAPGSGTSYGNAGAIATYGCVPVNSPSLIRDLPKLLLSKSAPLRIDWLYALTHLPWMLKFLRNCTPARVDAIARDLGSLLSHADGGLDPLIEATGTTDLFRCDDFLYVFHSAAAYQASEAATRKRVENGVKIERITGGDIRDLEPNLKLDCHAGLRFLNGRHVRNPEELVQRFFATFIANGGNFISTKVRSCDASHDAEVMLTLADGASLKARKFVVAAGAHAKSIPGSGAEDLPLDTERGYHVQYSHLTGLANRPVCWAEGGFYATPMDVGLRFAGTVEIAGLDAPPTRKRTDTLTAGAHRMFGDIGQPDSTWLGFRPTMPDSLPVIGRSARSQNILFAFGHQHLGLTLGGITGRIVADLLDDRAQNFDISAFAPDRFT